MSRFYVGFGLSLLTLFILNACSTMNLTHSTEPVKQEPVKQVPIVSPVPFAKETVGAPEGFSNCFTVKEGFYDNKWLPEHRVCQYENMPGKVAWVQGYWACTAFAIGQCSHWEWNPAHWSETLVSY